MAVHGMPVRGDVDGGGLIAAQAKSSGIMLPDVRQDPASSNVTVLSPGTLGRPETSGQATGPASGLILGLAIGLIMWAGIITVVWRVLRG